MPVIQKAKHEHIGALNFRTNKALVDVVCEECTAWMLTLTYDPDATDETIIEEIEEAIIESGLVVKYSRDDLLALLAQYRFPRTTQELTTEMAIRYMRLHLEHVRLVSGYLAAATNNLTQRAIRHDDSKWYEPEFTPYARNQPRFDAAEYGTPEYRAAVDAIKPAVQYHVTTNPHHPECYTEGVNGMTLFDVLEMLCDWMAACQRVKEETPWGKVSNLRLDLQQDRFKISDQLLQILVNTVQVIDQRFEPSGGNVFSLEEP
jgi:hypothetical protein